MLTSQPRPLSLIGLLLGLALRLVFRAVVWVPRQLVELFHIRLFIVGRSLIPHLVSPLSLSNPCPLFLCVSVPRIIVACVLPYLLPPTRSNQNSSPCSYPFYL